MDERRREAGWLLWQMLGDLARMLRPQMEPLLREVGMGSPVEAWVCALVHFKGRHRLVDIARAVHLPVSTLSDLTDRLVAEGFLRREPNPRDRRSVVLAATERGAQAVRRLHEGAADRLQAPLASLDGATLEHLTVGLRALAAALEGAREPPVCEEPAPTRAAPGTGDAPEGPR